MLIRVHYTLGGEEDSIVLSGDTIEELRELALQAVSDRGGVDAWSEELEDVNLAAHYG